MMSNNLALYGGTPVFENQINYSQHLVTKEDRGAVEAVLRSNWLAGRSDVVKEFEDRIADYTGYTFAIAVNSATSGLYVAMMLLRKANPQSLSVSVPSLTFVATMNAPLLAGWQVKVVDVNKDTFLMEPDNSSIPVSYAGYPVDQAHLVIDAAHELNRHMGDIGSSLAVISTHAIKPLTTGEGGVVLTNSHQQRSFLRELSDHGNGGGLYGHNFRMSSIQAALGLSQLERADEMFAVRREIAAIYRDRLAQHGSIKLQRDHKRHSNHIFPIVLGEAIDRDWFKAALLAEGVRTQIHYEPLHILAKRHSQHGRIDAEGEFPASESMWYHGLSLPIHNAMTLKDARMVMDAVDKIMESLL
jgi:UDP-4-amino-4,6-dideoxy-L-N-acetyl-beta-L-altrosamine transaminase